jgi:ArsR family transcriptional regulator
MKTEATFRSLADATRLRIVRLLGSMELSVGEIAQVLAQSQPRVSRHVGILCDSGLIEKRREGSWVFLRIASSGGGQVRNPLAAQLAALLADAETTDGEFAALCRQDRERLTQIRSARENRAHDYFAEHAENWDELRQLHSSDEAVETALAKALNGPLGALLDVGTGTGRMAEFFARKADHIVALDRSLAMLKLARAKLQSLPAAQVELIQGDFLNLPFDDASFDTVLFHQVLHFAADPALALIEAARVTKPGGRIALVDFAAHNKEELREKFAHERLGFADDTVAELMANAGYFVAEPVTLEDGELTVKIWVGQRSAAAVPAQNYTSKERTTISS